MVEWREILDGHYAVSDAGEVMRVSPARGATPGRIRKPLPTKGHGQVMTCVGHKRKLILTCRVVAEAFIGPVPPKYYVRHRDGDTRNCRLDNLEIVRQPGHRKLTDEQVAAMRKEARFTKRLVPGERGRLAQKYGIHPCTVTSILHGRSR